MHRGTSEPTLEESSSFCHDIEPSSLLITAAEKHEGGLDYVHSGWSIDLYSTAGLAFPVKGTYLNRRFDPVHNLGA